MIRYACAKCGTIIPLSAIGVRLTNDGKLEYAIECHGEVERFVRSIFPDMEGVLFSGKSSVELHDRRPDAWVKLAKSVLTDEVQHGGLLSRGTVRSAGAVMARLGE